MKKEIVIKFYSDFKLYIFPVIVALSSLFLIIFAIYPQTAKLIEDQRSTGVLISKSRLLETKAAALEGFNEEELSQKVGLVLASLPAEKDFGNVFDLLQRLITGSGFSINSITLGGGGLKAKSSDSYEVKVEVKGPRAMFPVLLKNLENSPRLIRVNSIDVASHQNAQEIDASLVIGVLYSQAPQNFGTVDAPLPQIGQKEEELLVKLGAGRSTTTDAQDSQVPSPSRGKSNPFE